jgi:hypothetical protein
MHLTQLLVPKIRVDGEDKGVQHSLVVEKDLFTDGPLVITKHTITAASLCTQ